MARDIAGGREYNRLRTTYYSYNVYNHLNDSRLWKTLRTKQNGNRSPWNAGGEDRAGTGRHLCGERTKEQCGLPGSGQSTFRCQRVENTNGSNVSKRCPLQMSCEARTQHPI